MILLYIVVMLMCDVVVYKCMMLFISCVCKCCVVILCCDWVCVCVWVYVCRSVVCV